MLDRILVKNSSKTYSWTRKNLSNFGSNRLLDLEDPKTGKLNGTTADVYLFTTASATPVVAVTQQRATCIYG